MKRSYLLSYLLLFSLILSSVFLNTSKVYASDTSYRTYTWLEVYYDTSSLKLQLLHTSGGGNVYSGSSTQYSRSPQVAIPSNATNVYTMYINNIVDDNNTTLVPKGSTGTLSLTNYYCLFNFLDVDNNRSYLSVPSLYSGYYILHYVDGTQGETVYFDTSEYSYSSETHSFDLNLSFDAEKDVRKVAIYVMQKQLTYNNSIYGNVQSPYYSSVFGSYSSSRTMNIALSVDSAEVGLLEGLLAWVKNIYTNVGNMLTSVKNGFSNIGTWLTSLGDRIGIFFDGLMEDIGNWFDTVFNWLSDTYNAILDLPDTIWTAFKNGLTSLFVPDSDFLIEYSDTWDSLLESHMGGIYEVVDIVHSSWGELENYDNTNTINIPEVTIPLPEDNEFSFGGYDVPIVPEGFEILANACKLICGTISTVLCVNGLMKRWDTFVDNNN